MATKKASESVAMFGEVETVPKREGKFEGRKADPKKVAHIMAICESFAAFASEQQLEKGQQVPVANLGDWTPSQLSITGNKMLDRQRDNGSDPGFYFVATEVVDKKPTKLVIRTGSPVKRNRRK